MQEFAIISAEAKKNINEHVNLLSEINEIYKAADVLGKRQLLMLFFPEKITLDKDHFEFISTRAVHAIYNIKVAPNNFSANKMDLKIPTENINQYLKNLQFKRGSINADNAWDIIIFLRKLALLTIMH